LFVNISQVDMQSKKWKTKELAEYEVKETNSIKCIEYLESR